MQTLLHSSRTIGQCGLQQAARNPPPILALVRRHQQNPAIGSGIHARPLQAVPEQQASPKPAVDDEELPPWVRREKERELQAQQGSAGLPWPLYLLFSILTAIAAVGSTFEYIDHNPIFGVLPPENPLWAPILLFFAVTGIPTSGFLFMKGVNGFNAEAERQDKLDGYL